MPEFQPKDIQKQLKEKKTWPLYWIYGSEEMKKQELLKRIQKEFLGDSPSELSIENIDAGDCTVATLLDSAQTIGLLSSQKLIIVRNAHLLKEAEALEPLLDSEDSTNIVVMLSKDLDKRKKFSKILIKKAAVIECADVGEMERENWIQYLAQARGLKLEPPVIQHLISLEPWSLMLLDQELQKVELADPKDVDQILTGAINGLGGSQAFMEAFFQKNTERSLQLIERFADKPQEAIPLLGLLNWYVRQLILMVADPKQVRLNRYIQDKIRAWASHWKLEELKTLQHDLYEIDFSLKQTPRLPLGSWTSLALKWAQTETNSHP